MTYKFLQIGQKRVEAAEQKSSTYSMNLLFGKGKKRAWRLDVQIKVIINWIWLRCQILKDVK